MKIGVIVLMKNWRGLFWLVMFLTISSLFGRPVLGFAEDRGSSTLQNFASEAIESIADATEGVTVKLPTTRAQPVQSASARIASTRKKQSHLVYEPDVQAAKKGHFGQWGQRMPAVGQVCERPAREILQQMEDMMRGTSSYSEMTMKIVRPRYTRELSMKAWQKGGESSMILITSPARDRGTAFLMHDKDIWTYDPRIDRTTRLPSSMMSQSWMGSDFSNDDLVRESDILDDYEYRVIGEEMVAGELACKLELIPRPEAPVVWGRVLLWVSAEGGYQLRVENYDQRGELAYIMVLEDIREIGGRILPTRFRMMPAGKEDEFTEMMYGALQFDVKIEDSFFRKAMMQRLN